MEAECSVLEEVVGLDPLSTSVVLSPMAEINPNVVSQNHIWFYHLLKLWPSNFSGLALRWSLVFEAIGSGLQNRDRNLIKGKKSMSKDCTNIYIELWMSN